MGFSKHSLDIDAQAEADRICEALVRTVTTVLRRNGAVVGISGGVDSSVVLALCARAFGPDRVRALTIPERDSEPESELLANRLAAAYGVKPVREEISAPLDGFGCYPRRDAAIRRVFPDFDAAAGYRARITLPSNLLDGETLNVFSLTVVKPDGSSVAKILPPREYRQIVAASNLKQRARMMALYYHAELEHYAVIGTANKNERDMGFFVKYGDGGSDVAAIAHLYKTQVYQLAAFLGVPEAIRLRQPTTDTYSAPTTQQDFFFRLPFHELDLLWYAKDHGVSAADAGAVMGLSEAQALRAFADFERKTRAAAYLLREPVSLGPGEAALAAGVASVGGASLELRQ
jgi:NAD+ synthase